MLLKCCTQYVSKFGKLSSGHRKRSIFIPTPKENNPKECLNYCTIVLISHASKAMLKILQGRLQQYVNQEFQMYKLGLRKGRGTRDQTASVHRFIEKAREFQKNICFIDYTKAFDLVETSCGKFLKRWKYQITLPVS